MPMDPALQEEIETLLKRIPPPPWKWWTSNSWKRLKSGDDGHPVNVLEPYVARDGHQDLNINPSVMEFLQKAPEWVKALLAEVKRAEDDILVNRLKGAEGELREIEHAFITGEEAGCPLARQVGALRAAFSAREELLQVMSEDLERLQKERLDLIKELALTKGCVG